MFNSMYDKLPAGPDVPLSPIQKPDPNATLGILLYTYAEKKKGMGFVTMTSVKVIQNVLNSVFKTAPCHFGTGSY